MALLAGIALTCMRFVVRALIMQPQTPTCIGTCPGCSLFNVIIKKT